jgi:lipid-binding SYLF domain-containing protein
MTTQTRMQVTRMLAFGALAALAAGLAAAPTRAAAGGDQAAAVKQAQATVEEFRRADPGLARFFEGAVGYAVFPAIGKGGAVVGAAWGRGVLFERGDPTGLATLTQVTVGAQLGGQSYSELVFFETPEALASFKRSQLAMAAQASAVVAASGASADARYGRGVAVFTLPRAGLMAEASVGGQRFAFRPFGKANQGGG